MTFERPILLVALAAVPLVFVLAVFTRQELARSRRVLSAGLRALTLAALALAAAEPALLHASAPSRTAIVLDRSPSVGEAGRPKLDALLHSTHDAVALECGQDGETDLASALRLAAAKIGAGRIALLSDGRETRGSARDEAARLHARGFVVDCYAIPEKDPLDARVVRVDLGASEAREGEGLIIRVDCEATRPCSGEVTLTRDGVTKPGWTLPFASSVTFHDRAERRGVHRYEARVTVPGDAEPENDVQGAALLVRGGPRAVVVELDALDGEAVSRVLAAQGFSVKRVTPEKAPDAAELDATDLVVLASGELAPEKARALDAFVREGGGLLALGGARSYSGWRKTEVDEALPVTAEPDQTERPQVAIVIAIDRSGSMKGPKMELAKLAARNACWGLGKDDLLGVIAFNYQAWWIVPLDKLTDRAKVQGQIEMQAAGGGTDLMPSLREAKAVLLPSNARVKHFLVLTDGIAGDEDAVIAYTADLARSGITTSTVAVGEDAEQGFLVRIAAAGQGHEYNASQVSELPRIVMEDTLVCARQAMEVEPFGMKRVRQHEALNGVEVELAPPLHGLNATKAKPLASVVLEGPRGLPLLAVWEHGLGKAAAWTSDATPRWADAWLDHPSFPKLMAQLARHLARREGSAALDAELSATPVREGARIRAEVRRKDGRFASDLVLEARVRGVEGEVARVPLGLTAPGRYEGTAVVGSGSYLVEARLGQITLATSGFARGASLEHERIGADREALAAIARAGGGALDPERPSEVPPSMPRREPLAGWLLILAAVLVPGERGIRCLFSC